MAARHEGRLTVVEVAGELAVPTTTAEELLNELIARELADIEITESGLLVYAFHDVQVTVRPSRGRTVVRIVLGGDW